MKADENQKPQHPSNTDRYAEFLSGAVEWLHYEKASIDQLTKSEVNQLARLELGRRDYDGPIEDEPRKIWAWLFVEYTLHRDHDRHEE